VLTIINTTVGDESELAALPLWIIGNLQLLLASVFLADI
jgi:hypothetical protein